jgi:hypothetical protein
LASPDGEKLVEPTILAFIADSSPIGDTAVSMDVVTTYTNGVRAAMRAFSNTIRTNEDRAMMIGCEDGGFGMPRKNHVEKVFSWRRFFKIPAGTSSKIFY